MKPIFSCRSNDECEIKNGLTINANGEMDEFTLHLRASIGNRGWNSALLEWGDSLSVYTRRAGQDIADAKWDDTMQNYLSFPDDDGVCDIIEAAVKFKNHNPEWNKIRVGVPAALIGKGRIYDIVLRFNGASLALFIDGVLADEDWTVGMVPTADAPMKIGGDDFYGNISVVDFWARAMDNDEIINLSGGAEHAARRECEIYGENRSMLFWSPRGHNQWFGDAMLGDTRDFPDGRFHIYYLTDRRHGASKFNCGGHSICSMSTADMINWDHHPTAFELENWESVGTGRPMVIDGKMLLFYGMHTSRIMPKNTLVENAIDADGYTMEEIFPSGDRYPQGTSYAESTDGIIFTKSRRLLHPAQNPNVCRDENGDGYLLLAGYGANGLWQSDDLSRWKLINEDIILTNSDSATRNTNECQCMFEWNGWHYLIAGRTGFWMSRSQHGPYWEGENGEHTGVVKPRWDIYDGLWVPMVGTFGDNRRVMAGFLQGPDYDWGGHLVMRELVQFDDGTLGTKWLPEIIPAVKSAIIPVIKNNGQSVTENKISLQFPSSPVEIENLPSDALVTMNITCMDSSFVSISIVDENRQGCALTIFPRLKRVQWNTFSDYQTPPMIPDIKEILSNDDTPLWEMQNMNLPFHGYDFTITDVENLDATFTVELICKYDKKSRSTIIDACVNNQRTLITRRKGIIASNISFAADNRCEINNIKIQKF